MSDDALLTIKQTFFIECDELLAELETGLLSLKDDNVGPDTVNAIFRAVHSIKGGAGAFHLNSLVQFAHGFETTLDQLRSGRITASQNCIKVLLRASDMLADLIRCARDGKDDDESHWRAILRELKLLSEPVAPSISPPKEEPVDNSLEELAFQPIAISFEDILNLEAGNIAAVEQFEFTIGFKASRELYAKANEPLILLRELSQIGACTVVCDDSAVPLLNELDPEESYLSWTASVLTEGDEEQKIRDIFEFVESDCSLIIEKHKPKKICAPLRSQSACQGSPQSIPLGELPVQAHVDIEPQQSSNVIEKSPLPPVPSAPKTIRVEVERVDRFVDLIGELVINQAMLAQKVSEIGLSRGSPIAISLDEIDRLLRAIQDSAMSIRAQPVKPVFQRMSRVVREAADATGKVVQLITEGENAEVDKTVIERLTDPLTHMIRNAIDHGIETPEKRIASGKPAEGVVRLSAHHRSGRIVIEISDDGAGINRAQVKEIAIKRGLIPANAILNDDEVDDLIFQPGFSTAQTVTDMSGRGVGMDVVRRSIQALGGRIGIVSRRGEGSTFGLSLPLTLAVLDGMVVTVASQTLVIPLASIVETLMPKPECIQALGADSCVILVRGEVNPITDLGAELGFRSPLRDFSSSIAILIETERYGRLGLIVDSILDQRQIVIKSLEGNYGAVPGVAAATILGDGRVALIVDVDAIAANNNLSSKVRQSNSTTQVSV